MTRFEAVAVPSGVLLENVPRALLGSGGRVAVREAGRLDELEVVYPDLDPRTMGHIVERLSTQREELASRPIDEIVAALGQAGSRFRTSGDPIREAALDWLPFTSGLSPEMCEVVLDGMARDWSEEPVWRMLEVELEDPGVLDGFVELRGRRAMAMGPRLCVQIVAGSVPGVGVSALVRSLAVKAPTLLKPGRGDVVLPVLFARALRETDSDMADALAVVYWPGGSEGVEQVALDTGDVVTIYGSDDTVRAVTARAPVTTRVVAYHHRFSVGAVGVEALAVDAVQATVAAVASAVSLFDQRGCVSPHIVYVETDNESGVTDFVQLLAEGLENIEARLPVGELDMEEAAALQQLRGTAELLAAESTGRVRHGAAAATWTVVADMAGELAVGCIGRVVIVRPVRRAEEIPHLLRPHGPHLQTVAVAGFGERLSALAEELGRIGASRVVPFSSAAFPHPGWHHDGRGPITELVRWVELE